MAIDTKPPPSNVRAGLALDPAVEEHGERLRERGFDRAKRFWVVVVVALVVAVPVAVLGSLGKAETAPLWFDEQWRADYISYGGGWLQGLRADHYGSIAVGWFLVNRWTVELFGSTELTLRVPEGIFFVVNCVLIFVLARRWMPLVAAAVVALVGGITPDLVQYSVQLKPYVVDTAAVMAVLLLHGLARDHGARRRRAATSEDARKSVAAYLGIGVACLLGTATVFVAAPLLLVDTVVLLRSRANWRRFVPPVVAGVMAVANLAVEIHQNAPGESAYWASQYPPRHGIGAQASFYWHGLTNFVVQGLSDLASLGTWEHDALVAVWTALIVYGLLTVVFRRVAVDLAVGMFGALILMFAGSQLRRWPWGFGRTDLFMVPLLVLLAGVGGCRVAGRIGFSSRGRHRPRERVRTRGPAIVATSIVLLGLMGAMLGAAFDISGYYTQVSNQPVRRIDDGVGLAVATIRKEQTGIPAVMVPGGMVTNGGALWSDSPGWEYYLFEYSGGVVLTGKAIPPTHILFPLSHGTPTEARFLRNVRPTEVFIYEGYGTTIPQINQDLREASVAGYCYLIRSTLFPTIGGGELITLAGGEGCN